MFRLVYRAICRLVFRVVCYVQLLVFWKLRDLVLQMVVKIFVVIVFEIDWNKIQMWYFNIMSIKHNSKMALHVGWKICCWYPVVTFLKVRCSLNGQYSFAMVARTPIPQEGHHQISSADLRANVQSNFIIVFNTRYVKYDIWILSL
jgi:hypothetical protein